MNNGNGKDARAWMRANKSQLPPEELPNEKGSRSAAVGGTANAPTRDARALALAAEHADAARDILTHPALTEKERTIWALYIEGVRDEELCRRAQCATGTAKKAIDRIKALMLAPGDATPPLPKKDEAEEVFQDLERTIALGACNAHRVIADVFKRNSQEPEDVDNNEKAVRTVLAIRKSEWDYLQRKKPPEGSDEEARKVAGAVRV